MSLEEHKKEYEKWAEDDIERMREKEAKEIDACNKVPFSHIIKFIF